MYLAYDALPPHLRTVTRLFQTTNGMKVNGYIAAAALAIGIIPFTRLVMVPNNFALMDKNKAQGGVSSEGEARSKGLMRGPGVANGAKDPSRPQEQTTRESSEKQDKEVYDMLKTFSVQNAWRAALLAADGVVGLVNALQT